MSFVYRMRTLVTLSARNHFAYYNKYNHKLQGRLYNDLKQRGYETIHNEQGPKGFSYSNIFPPRDAQEGDTRRFIFAAPDDQLVTDVAYGLCSKPEVNIGPMTLKTEEAFTLDPAVEDQGTLTTGTPIVLRMSPEDSRNKGIDPEDHDRVYWRPKHGMDSFFDRLYANMQAKYRQYYDEDPPEPPYFSGYTLDRTVAKPVAFADGDAQFIGGEWTFEYELTSQTHRRMLNLMLDVGLGELNSLGFGFMNRGADV